MILRRLHQGLAAASRNLTRLLSNRSLLLAALAGAAFALSGAAANENPTLTPFYRATQLQGHFFGMGLVETPGYLGGDIAFPYASNGPGRHIPFADTFVINRVMGGYPLKWLEDAHLVRDGLGRRSLDYVTRGADGKLLFHPELIRARLQPYLDAGYKPDDITLALENIPWDLKTPDGSMPPEGPWGRKTPPGDFEEWGQVVRRLATDLKEYLGEDAERLSFETGVEYDEHVSFDADAAQFFKYYLTTDRALHAVLPNARMSPGEFTVGVCPTKSASCVYDTRDFLNFAHAEGLRLDDLPRSLYALATWPRCSPSATAAGSIMSYGRLPGAVPEVHQFGLLFEPFGDKDGDDPAAMYANWEFQALAKLILSGAPRRVFHWGGFAAMGKLLFLNGSGYLRLVLDHYVGSSVAALAVRDETESRSFPAETAALALTRGAAVAVILSSFSPRPVAGERPVSVDLPPSWRGTSARWVRYRASDNVFASLKGDLAADNNLKSEFATCALCLGQPQFMAVDVDRARQLFARNWPRYEKEMHEGLKWRRPLDSVVAQGKLTVRMEANELIVAEPIP
jgi:hypothetical protein